MLKKTIAIVGIAGALVLGGVSAANADTYPPEVNISANPASITVGGTTVITATGLGDLETVYFGTDGTSGGTVSSIVVAAAASGPVAKPVEGGSATANFTATAPGTYTIAVSDGETVLDTVTVTVGTATVPATGTTPALPPTGGELPAAALWLGLGAVGIGAIAVTAGVARRRAAAQR